MNEEIFEKVKEVIKEQLDVEDEKIVMEASFIEDLGADSLDIVELIMNLEDKFEIEIEDQEAEKLSTVEDVVNFIKNKKENK